MAIVVSVGAGLAALWAAFQLGNTYGWGKGWSEARDVYRPDAERWYEQVCELRGALIALASKRARDASNASGGAAAPQSHISGAGSSGEKERGG